jgi:hypothetical protein
MAIKASPNFSFLIQWWSVINRRLNPADIQAICWLILVTNTLILGLAFITQVSGRTVFGPQLGADFGAYYVAGRIYNSLAPERIYERELHQQLYHELFPATPVNEELPYLNAPFFILPFPLLARLHYAWAYLCWVVFSLGLYLAGFTLLYRTCAALPPESYKTALLLALSFMPFLVECLAGGQTSAVGFFSLAVALSCEQRGRRVLSGVVLSLCLYKPTLLVLMLPMLVLTRRWASLSGFLLGGGWLALLSWWLVGTVGGQSYLKLLFVFADASASDATTILKSWKYVDLNSFFRLLLGDFVTLRWAVTGIVFLGLLLLLVKGWWHAERAEQAQQSWAATITWSLVLNVYLGIYDATLVVLSVLLTTAFFYRRAREPQMELPPVYKLLLLLLYLVPWFTQSLARLTGVQIFTVVLVLLGGYQLRQLRHD